MLLEGYLTRTELAEEFDCSERTIARYEQRANGLPVTMVAGRPMYRLDAVKAWLARQERKANPRRAEMVPA